MAKAAAQGASVELWHLGEYTRELKRRLPRSYFEPVPARALWILPHLFVIAGSYWLTLRFDALLVKAAAALLTGLSFASLGFLAHEILHGSVVRTPLLRDLLGGLCFLPFCLGPKLWRKWHNVEHHGHTQHDDDDPDAMGTLEDYRERPSLQVLYALAPRLRSLLTFAAFTFWFSFHAFEMLRRFAPEFKGRDRLVVWGQFFGPAAFWCLLLAWLGPVNFAFAYVAPLFIANFVVMSYIATNHLLNPLTPVNDPLANSLTVQTARLLDVLHFNFSHHTEHHLFPAMNPKYAPKVKALVKELWPERYNEMSHWKALVVLWRTPRLYRDESNLVDPKRRLVYSVAGRGLDPDRVQGRPFDADA